MAKKASKTGSKKLALAVKAKVKPVAKKGGEKKAFTKSQVAKKSLVKKVNMNSGKKVSMNSGKKGAKNSGRMDNALKKKMNKVPMKKTDKNAMKKVDRLQVKNLGKVLVKKMDKAAMKKVDRLQVKKVDKAPVKNSDRKSGIVLNKKSEKGNGKIGGNNGGLNPPAKVLASTDSVAVGVTLKGPVKVRKAGRQAVPKPKKIKKVFTPYNPIQPASANGKPVNTSKKDPKGKFELEYVIRCSESLLYDFITSPSGLSEWFSDDVNIRDGIYTFYWDGSEQKARLLALKEEEFVRYQWMDKVDGSYFEFRIQTDELTGDVSLIIVDFADNEEEKLSSSLLWNAQVDKLMKMIGSHT